MKKEFNLLKAIEIVKAHNTKCYVNKCGELVVIEEYMDTPEKKETVVKSWKALKEALGY